MCHIIDESDEAVLHVDSYYDNQKTKKKIYHRLDSLITWLLNIDFVCVKDSWGIINTFFFKGPWIHRVFMWIFWYFIIMIDGALCQTVLFVL